MPYIIIRRDDQYCVYKEGADGQSSGESLGCHSSRREAERQIAAIEANERTGRSRMRILQKRIGGHRYMFLITSNGYRDREGEYVSVEALQQYCNEFDKNDSGQLLDFNHKSIIGKIVAAEMWGPFLVEVAKENDSRLAKIIWDFIEATPWLDWACSQRFYARKESGDVFRRINKDRTTVIRRLRAANALTGAGIIGDRK